jgi:hypothetical protein
MAQLAKPIGADTTEQPASLQVESDVVNYESNHNRLWYEISVKDEKISYSKAF